MISKEYKTIFIHIPKTAGTSISRFFQEKQISICIQPELHASIHDIKSDFPQAYKNYRKFTVVRNPYDRMVSWYFFLKESAVLAGFDLETVFPFNFIKWIEDPFKVNFTRWKLDTSDENKKGIPFLQPQHMWLDDTVNILRYENLNKDLNKFFEKKINLPLKNKSNLKKEHFLNYYNKHALDIVYERYKEDFEKFNYKRIEKI